MDTTRRTLRHRKGPARCSRNWTRPSDRSMSRSPRSTRARHGQTRSVHHRAERWRLPPEQSSELPKARPPDPNPIATHHRCLAARRPNRIPGVVLQQAETRSSRQGDTPEPVSGERDCRAAGRERCLDAGQGCQPSAQQAPQASSISRDHDRPMTGRVTEHDRLPIWRWLSDKGFDGQRKFMGIFE